jgi:hypothetical protein
VYQDEDGMVVVRGGLTPEAGAVLMQALTAPRTRAMPLSSFSPFVESLGFNPHLAQDIGQLPRDLLQGGEDLAIEV